MGNKIEAQRKDLDGIKMNKAFAEMNEMASGILTQIGGSIDTLDRLHHMGEEENTEVIGRTRYCIGASRFQENKPRSVKPLKTQPLPI